jgi:hypothetical protein
MQLKLNRENKRPVTYLQQRLPEAEKKNIKAADDKVDGCNIYKAG